MQDASYVKQRQAYQLRITPAQRYDVLISAIDRDRGNFPFLMSLDINRDFEKEATWPHNQTGYLVMEPDGQFGQDVVDVWRPHEESHFEPFDGEPVLEPVARTITLDFKFCPDENNIPRYANLSRLSYSC